MSLEVLRLTRLIDDEIIRALNLPADSWLGRHLHPLLRRATRRFSELFVECDRIIAEQGLPAGARWLLMQLVKDFRARGMEHLPPEGPLIVASNHPGTVDSITLATTAGRRDLKIVAGAIPFLQNLPSVRRHLIFTPEDPHGRIITIRQSIAHLHQGGALLLFARAGIDPDPAFMPHAEAELGGWSRSLEVFIRSVPQTRVVASIVSHVLEPRYMRHPVTWLRRARPDRQRLAMMLQIIQQMLGRKSNLVPRVSFGEALSLKDIGDPGDAHQRVIESARQLLGSHLAWQV